MPTSRRVRYCRSRPGRSAVSAYLRFRRWGAFTAMCSSASAIRITAPWRSATPGGCCTMCSSISAWRTSPTTSRKTCPIQGKTRLSKPKTGGAGRLLPALFLLIVARSFGRIAKKPAPLDAAEMPSYTEGKRTDGEDGTVWIRGWKNACTGRRAAMCCRFSGSMGRITRCCGKRSTPCSAATSGNSAWKAGFIRIFARTNGGRISDSSWRRRAGGICGCGCSTTGSFPPALPTG